MEKNGSELTVEAKAITGMCATTRLSIRRKTRISKSDILEEILRTRELDPEEIPIRKALADPTEPASPKWNKSKA